MKEKNNNEISLSCPAPIIDQERILMAHGGGGRLMNQLIEKLILPSLTSNHIQNQHDSIVLTVDGKKIAFTTDSFVVNPLFFPGGDIGKLAVYGTVNDLAMSGARPLYLSLSFILEEGFPTADLERILSSIQQASIETGVAVVTGDTKVVEKGKGDGIYINTSGIGIIEHQLNIGPTSVVPGDAILINGDLGRHGIAIMTQREGLEFETQLESDCASLSPLVQSLLKGGIEIHCLRDLTRGGLASALNEIAKVSHTVVEIEEAKIPIEPPVRGACELLGFDPFYVANEGRLVLFVPPAQADSALGIMRSHSLGTGANLIGFVQKKGDPVVVVKNPLGSKRILDMLSGEQLPRIC